MKKKWRHSKLFYQYLLSYLCILLLPLLLISVFVYQYVLNMLEREIQTNNLYTLQKAKDTIETQMRFMTSLEHSVYLNQILTSFRLEEESMEAIRVQEELRKYIRTNSFIHDMAYYQENDDYVLTADSSCQKELFFERMYHYDNWSYEEFLKDLEENSTSFFIPSQDVEIASEGTKQMVTLVRPIKDRQSPGAVIYLIESNFFTDVLPVDESLEGASAILDQEGRKLVYTGNGILLDEFIIETDQSADLGDKQDYITIHGQKYLQSITYSENYQWWYLTLVPAKDINDRAGQVKLLMLIMCGISCAGGLIGVMFFMKHNYTPIRRLENMTSHILENKESLNELDHVTKVLEYLSQQNERLSADDSFKTTAVRERFLIKLLSGQYDNEQQILEKSRKADIQMDKKLYCAAIYHIFRLPSGIDQIIEDAFLESAPLKTRILVRVQPETHRILLVIGYDKDKDERIGKYLADMSKIMQSDMKLEGICAAGSQAENVMEITKSYKEAEEALEYRIIRYEQKIIQYEDILNIQDKPLRVSATNLPVYIKNKEIEGLENFLKMALEEMKEGCSIRRIRKQCSDFVYTVEKIIQEMNRDYFIEKPLYYDIADVLKYENCGELMDVIYLVGCDIVAHLNELGGKTLMEELIGYVQENCFSCDFSTTAMAEEFKMSLPYLSQYFKNHMSRNLLDYVTDIKIQKAKELLRDTDLAVKEIAEEVGYYNVNSFIRRFKQVTSYTPSEYRKIIKK